MLSRGGINTSPASVPGDSQEPFTPRSVTHKPLIAAEHATAALAIAGFRAIFVPLRNFPEPRLLPREPASILAGYYDCT